jgi:hypothetical protein
MSRIAETHRPPMAALPEAATRAMLGAMRAVAGTGGRLTEADRQSLAGAGLYLFGHRAPAPDPDLIEPVAPAALAEALRGDAALAEEAMRYLAVMTLVDGELDRAKLDAVAAYAAALGIGGRRWLDDLADAARDRLREAMADMTRANMESITGQPWAEGADVNAWLMPYAGHEDRALAARFHALADLPRGSFGHAMWRHFHNAGYDVPGEAQALNVAFSLPHDAAHVLTGYDTTPRGEILVSTFTATMHRVLPMAGHVLPVLLTWHVGLRFNEVAGDARRALDSAEFWHAWAAGAATMVDTFDPAWDFWAHAEEDLAALRQRWNLPAEGLAPLAPA